MTVREATTDAEIRACWPVMVQLRPQYDEDGFVEQVRSQQPDGYRLAMVLDDGTVVAVAGFRISSNLAWGKFLYVDDLVTES